MRRSVAVIVVVGSLLAAVTGARAQAPSGFVLSTTKPGGRGFAPAFVGNGYLAGRQPAAGQGFARVPLPGADQPLPTQSEVQGLYAKTSKPDEGLIERRAALPAWSTLRYDDGSGRSERGPATARRPREAVELDTDHSPFLSRTSELAAALERLAGAGGA